MGAEFRRLAVGMAVVLSLVGCGKQDGAAPAPADKGAKETPAKGCPRRMRPSRRSS